MRLTTALLTSAAVLARLLPTTLATPVPLPLPWSHDPLDYPEPDPDAPPHHFQGVFDPARHCAHILSSARDLALPFCKKRSLHEPSFCSRGHRLSCETDLLHCQAMTWEALVKTSGEPCFPIFEDWLESARAVGFDPFTATGPKVDKELRTFIHEDAKRIVEGYTFGRLHY